jgi:anion-transporting  ArsA/GET3 family ATPase
VTAHVREQAISASAARELSAHLEGKRIVICLGAGGVGKTTISAALALGLAARGQKVAVVTIDPARRLAAALGLTELAAEPRRIDADALTRQGLRLDGELWAMMLDAKRTFDEIIARLAPDERAREEILANSVYRELSTAVAGSHELSAIAKLYELHEEHDFDVIVLDTPPSRNALDFLGAPRRLLGFLEGRALQVFLAPGGLTARLFGRGTGLAFAIFARVTGIDMFGELSAFFRSLSGVTDAFAERTRGVAALLRAPSTGFVIVTSPEAAPAREAVFLADSLGSLARPAQQATAAEASSSEATVAASGKRGALVINRVHRDGLQGHTQQEVRELLAPELGDALAGRVARNLADFDVLASRDAAEVARLSAALEQPDPVLVPHLEQEVQDLLGLARVADHLLG